MLTYSGGMISLDPSLRVSSPRISMASNWWPSSAIAAWQAKGAASLAASLVNLITPGTHDLPAGSHPMDWNATDGWIGDGTSKYFLSDVTPGDAWSILARWDDATLGDSFIFGSSDATATHKYFAVENYGAGNQLYYAHQAYLGVTPKLNSGVAGFSGQQGYRNGSPDGGAIATTSGTYFPVAIGALNMGNSSIAYYTNAKLKAIWFADSIVSAGDMATSTAAMAAL
jgi:hypothetical protein